MFWAFVGGAADSINQDLKARKASEEEQRVYKERMEMQQKIMEAAEEAKRKNRVIAEGVDLNRGVAYEQTASGGYTEMALPKQHVEGMRQQTALAAEKERLDREREEKKFAAELRKADASISASEARAQAQRASASLTPLRAEKLKAETERVRTDPATEDKEAKRDAERAERRTEVEIGAAYREAAKHPDPRVVAAAREVRFSNRTPEEKLAILAELAASE